MKSKMFLLFIFSFVLGCAQMGEKHSQNNSDSLKNTSDSVRNYPGSAEDTANGLIIPTGKMQSARAAHTATILKSGKVLIAGGFASSALRGAEIYDPALKTFSSVGQMSAARSGHTATLLPNGQVLIAGGYNGSYLSSTEIFDPQTQTFSPGPVMNIPRSGHTATVLNNRKILFAGGVGVGWSFLQSAELYDIQTNTFASTGSMTTARESHTATLLKNGNVLIVGGHKGRRTNISIYSSAELYDPVSQNFKLIGNMSIIRHKHDATRLTDGSVLITGGSDERDSRGTYISAELYDPVSSSFKPAANMNISRYKHNGTSILLPNGNVLIAGGANRVEIYQTGAGKFVLVYGRIGTERLFSCATLLQSGEVLITGGYNENQETSAASWLYVYKKVSRE